MKETTARSSKDYRLSVIRLTALLLVIMCHTCEWLGSSLGKGKMVEILGNYCAVGVQIFLILSGFLYGKRENLFLENTRCDFLWRNCKKILFKYYVYIIIFVLPLTYCLRPGLLNASRLWHVLTCSAMFEGIQHLWYIPYILVCYLLTPLLWDIKEYARSRSKVIFCFVFLISIVLTEILGRAYGSYFVSAWINCYILGFYLPDFLEMCQEKKIGYITVFIAGMSIVLNVYSYKVRYIVLPGVADTFIQEMCNKYINYSRCVLAIAVFLVLYLLVKENRIARGKISRLLDASDKYSYDIYLVHMMYVKGMLSVLDITDYLVVNFILMVVIIIFSAFVLEKTAILIVSAKQTIINKMRK